ncbi:MAG: hypothetical protein JWP70_2048 [Leifsonia sp.]|jgi:hypothetical protein|nr:hypothetical protein [Leifsonia sp.]
MGDVANEDFVSALVASGPTSNYPERMRRFGRLVGTWSIASRTLDEHTQEWAESELTWTFAYVLDGRAVQDVLTGPSRADPSVTETRGSTIRAYDPVLGVWRVNWFSPASGDYCTLVATGHRDGIRQDGTQTDGRPIRWNFSAITQDSFAWDGWVSNDEGATWWLEQHMDGRRIR